MFNPTTGAPIWQHDAAAVAKYGDDAGAAELMEGLSDYPYAHDEQGRRIQAVRVEQVPATLRAKILEQIPSYIPQQRHDVKVDARVHGAIRIGMREAPLKPPPQPVIDPQRIEELKRQAREALSATNRITKPTTPVTVYKPSDEPAPAPSERRDAPLRSQTRSSARSIRFPCVTTAGQLVMNITACRSARSRVGTTSASEAFTMSVNTNKDG